MYKLSVARLFLCYLLRAGLQNKSGAYVLRKLQINNLHSVLIALCCLLVIAPVLTHAAVVEDWGTIVTPLDEDLTFDFTQTDITKNFTDQYTFSLEGSADAFYEVTFNVDFCSYGCGNVAVSYGIYDANGGLVTEVSAGGTLSLATGDYTFQVKGTGMGAGNSVDYFGEVTFKAVVSPAPEPPAYILMLVGGLSARWYFLRTRHRRTRLQRPDSSLLARQGNSPLIEEQMPC